MDNWISGIRGTILMIVIWVVGWSIGFGGLIEAFIDSDGEIMDIWPTAMAIPGLIGGIVFSAALWLAESRRNFDEIPIARIAIWGAVAGVVIGGVAFAKSIELTLTSGKIFVITIALGIISAIGSAVFFRLVKRWISPKVEA